MKRVSATDQVLRWLPVAMGIISLAYSWGMIHSDMESIKKEIAKMESHETRISKLEGKLGN
ncbi:hypothetical protein LPTSP1_36980 [Leptospira johnsonii]|uniref:Uncharacterized protein n=1 Tax=Leptospira johnsonii TaxID=1917820 RepID=A0A2P2D7T1_9LEPT|nr:hypothetical protein LPTSP1_36980 [Leptospira johnsonii]